MYKYAILTEEEKNEIREKTAKFIGSRHTDGTISIPAELLVIPNFVKVDDSIAQQLANVWNSKNFCKTVSVIIIDGICYIVAGANRARAIEFMQSSPVVFCEVLGNTKTVSTGETLLSHWDSMSNPISLDDIPCCFEKSEEPVRPGVARVFIPGRTRYFKKILGA